MPHRKPHRESSIGEFTAPLEEDGSLVQRKGFHVECKHDLDCFSRCGSHPVTGMHYVCTHKLGLYSHAGYSKEAYNDQVEDSQALKVAGEPHPVVWRPDSSDDNFYLMEEPGAAKYDIQRGTGVCTDTHIDYMHTGCQSQGAALSTLALTGCSGRAFGWANFFCGVEIDYDEDYVTDVGISARTILYPRTLVEEAQVNGKTMLRQTCSNALDCMDKCDFMERSARDGGLPAPTACAMCDPPCPSNIGESLVSFVQAFRDDVTSAIRLAMICLDPVACVCQVFMLLKPAWLDNLPDELQKCSVATLMEMIKDKIAVWALTTVEDGINNLIIRPINSKILRPIKNTKIELPFGQSVRPFQGLPLIREVCIPYKASEKEGRLKDCNEWYKRDLAYLYGCSVDDKSLWKRCYYERVRHLHV